MKLYLIRNGIITFLLCVVSFTSYAVGYNGVFIANAACPLYVSKNNLTNPDNSYTEVGKSYTIKEANVIPAQWYRVALAPDNLRWVEANCGTAIAESDSVNQINKPSPDKCVLQSGKADSYVVAFSMQAGFCETFGYAKGKPECTNLKQGSTYIKQFSLHGLWPNQLACGTNYGFCDNTKKEKTHCDYAPLNINMFNNLNLNKYMPSYAFNSCLERHEWYKHGTCQLRDVNDYYALALDLTRQINNSEIGNFIKVNTGKTVSIPEFYNQFEQSFGTNSSKKIRLICKNNILVDIYANLPNLDTQQDINNTLDLKSLITSGQNEKKPIDGCKTEFKLSDFSADKLY